MGYDISTVGADPSKSEAFAKEYGYTYMFDKETGEFNGDPNPYFRANIWGMGHIRRALVDMYVASKYNEKHDEQFSAIMEALSWNDGKLISPTDCQLLIDIFDEHKAMELALQNVQYQIAEDPDYLTYRTLEGTEWVKKTATVTEAAEGQVNLLKEFIVYLGIAKNLEGCQVW